MAKPYDATGKDLIELSQTGWLELLGVRRPPEIVRDIDADVSAVTATADKVIHVADDPAWILHIEFQTGRDAFLPGRMLMYNAVLHSRHRVAVRSVVFLLRPEADGTGLTGHYRIASPIGADWTFGYTVVRVWELPVEDLLAGPLALLPPAPVSAKNRGEVRPVVTRMGDRLWAETDPATFERLAQAALYLLTMRYDAMIAKGMFADHPAMKEVFELLRNDGRVEGQASEARALLRRQGRKRFGPPKLVHEATITQETDLAILEALSDCLLDVTTWDELFANME